ncbi:hypothetical protein TNCV_2596391 [Trichonephila clavipes]|nr:hypothetical protein TNCV_2596391 [Trichonephila clavipes]
MLNDDEIVTSVQEESDLVDDEMNEDEFNNNSESRKGPSNSDTFSALETAFPACDVIFNIRIVVSGFIYCMDRIRFSVIRIIAYPNDVRSQLIRLNDALL